MGIKNLIKLVNKTFAISKTKITDYKNKRVAIDTNLLIYKLIYTIRKNKLVITFEYSMKQKLEAFKKYNITPIFVFDGLHIQLKQTCINKRKEQAAKYCKFDTVITTKDINEAKTLIQSYNYQIIHEEEEADIILSRLARKNKIDYVISDDMDILLFGAPHVILLKDFTINTKLFITEINSKKLLQDLIITRKELIDIGIMLGCDYCESVKNVGPVKAYDIIVNNKQWKKPNNYNQVVKYFLDK